MDVLYCKHYGVAVHSACIKLSGICSLGKAVSVHYKYAVCSFPMLQPGAFNSKALPCVGISTGKPARVDGPTADPASE